MAVDFDDLAELTRVRLADAHRIAGLLARAFQDDPLMRYAIPDASQRARFLPSLIGLTVRYGCRYGEVYATPGYEGAAIWFPPERTTMLLWRMLRVGMFAVPLRIPWPILRRFNAANACSTAVHERCAPGAHWFLVQLGVEPSHQRQGIASRLLQPMLARIDAAALPCYLETENEANIAFYQRHGFRVVADDVVPRGGPRIWALVRAGRG